MGNSLIAAYDRQFSRNSVIDLQKVSRKTSSEDQEDNDDETVAKPLRPPYEPSDIKIRNPIFVQDIFPQKNGSFISMHTFSLPTSNGNQGNRFFQTHSMFHTIDKVDDPLCPVAISSRPLEPVRVGTGVVLTKVVQVLEDYPLTNEDSSAFSSTTFHNKHKSQVPRAPVPSPDLFLKNFGPGLKFEEISESFEEEEGMQSMKAHSRNFDISLTNSPVRGKCSD